MQRRHDGAADTGNQEPDERGDGEDRSRCRLADGDRIDKLALRQPVGCLDHVGMKERQEDVSTTEADGPELEEGQEDGDQRRAAEAG